MSCSIPFIVFPVVVKRKAHIQGSVRCRIKKAKRRRKCRNPMLAQCSRNARAVLPNESISSLALCTMCIWASSAKHAGFVGMKGKEKKSRNAECSVACKLVVAKQMNRGRVALLMLPISLPAYILADGRGMWGGAMSDRELVADMYKSKRRKAG
jgi:hypothetical protein